MSGLSGIDVPAVLDAFDLGSWGQLSDAPVASGRVGSIWRMDTDSGSWAVKQVSDVSDGRIAEIREEAAFQEAALSAGIGTPEVRRTRSGDVIADIGQDRIRIHAWVEMREPNTNLDPVELGRFVARLHCVDFEGTIGLDPWYTDPVGAAKWSQILTELRDRRAPFADELAPLIVEIIELEKLLGRPPRRLRTCHRDLWADNLRRLDDGSLCVFDFDNAGLADPSQELALILVEYGGNDPLRAAAIRDAYAEAGGPGRVESSRDFAMPIAQLGHIVAEGCRRWLIATNDAERADNEAWVREVIDRPLTRSVIDALLAD